MGSLYSHFLISALVCNENAARLGPICSCHFASWDSHNLGWRGGYHGAASVEVTRDLTC